MIQANSGGSSEQLVTVPRIVVRAGTSGESSVLNCLAAEVPGVFEPFSAVFLFASTENARRFLAEQALPGWQDHELDYPTLRDWLIEAANLQNATVAFLNARPAHSPIPTPSFDVMELIHAIDDSSSGDAVKCVCRFLWF